MITPAHYEDAMQLNRESKNLQKAISDTCDVLKEYGYDAGAEILIEMTENGDDRK